MTKRDGTMKRLAQSANQTLRRSIGSHTQSAAQLDPGHSSARYTGALNKQWRHPPDALIYGRVEYTVKFLGECEVAAAKGTTVVKEAVEKLRYRLQLEKTASGKGWTKLKKVDIHINIEGVSIIDGKSSVVLYKYPLHRISFCADDKQDRRVFAFIAKRADCDRHDCYVFSHSEKAEEITLTVGEAFDLAYRKFLERSGRDMSSHKQLLVLQRRIAQLEQENDMLKAENARLRAAENFGDGRADHRATEQSTSAARSQWTGFHEAGGQAAALNNDCYGMDVSHSYETANGAVGMAPALPDTPVPKGPPQGFSSAVTAGNAAKPEQFTPKPVPAERKSLKHSKSESGALPSQHDIFDDEFDPRGERRAPPVKQDSFGQDPFNDDFFTSVVLSSGTQPDKGPSAAELEDAINAFDSRLNEIKQGFERGLQMGSSARAAKPNTDANSGANGMANSGGQSQTPRSDDYGSFGAGDLLKEFGAEDASSP